MSRKYALESSKADQRLLFDRLFDDANPRFRVFDPRDYHSDEAAVSDFKRFAARARGAGDKAGRAGEGRGRRRVG